VASPAGSLIHSGSPVVAFIAVMPNRLRLLGLLLALVSVPLAAAGQPPPPPPGPPQGPRPGPNGALRVFLDCQRCDFDFLRREITFINYVRDRKDAEVHALVTTQSTGSGGTEYAINYIGLGRFAGKDATLRYSSLGTDTDDERRRGFAQVFQLGLMRYVAETPLASEIQIGRRPPAQGPPTAANAGEDPWNFWIFRISTNGDYRSEERTKRKSIRVSFSANRTTEAWKFGYSSNLNYNDSRYVLSDGDTYVNVTRNYSNSGQLVKSLNDHWSAAVRGGWSRSTFLNQDLLLNAFAGVEYNIFPYAESSTRELTFQYLVGVDRVNYEEETIFDKMKETLYRHSLDTSLSLRQPWGTSRVSLEFRQYLHDLSKNSLQLDGNLNVRLFRGFSFDIDGNVSRIRDQLYLVKGEATDEEVLLLRRQLGTAYRYEFGFGITYQFGSIFNNVVNPRFGGGGGRR